MLLLLFKAAAFVGLWLIIAFGDSPSENNEI